MPGDVDAYERRFRRAGLPLLIEDYTARGDIFTRAIPLLGLVFAGEMLGAIDLQWTWYANVAAALGALAVLLLAVGLLNRLGGRPFRSIPTRVGIPELTAFVLDPGSTAGRLQRADDERDRHRRREPRAARRDLPDRRVRRAADRALGGRAAAR